jgi:hypothetical protein
VRGTGIKGEDTTSRWATLSDLALWQEMVDWAIERRLVAYKESYETKSDIRLENER